MGAWASNDHYFYAFGGDDAPSFNQESYCGSLHQLDVHTLTWTQLAAHTPDGPTKKSGSRMFYHQHSLFLFGGYGIHGATNELHAYNLAEGETLINVEGTKQKIGIKSGSVITCSSTKCVFVCVCV